MEKRVEQSNPYTHVPVLLKETVEYLAPSSEKALLVDATLGEGGHSAAFLSRFPLLQVIGVEVDERILARARERLAPFEGRVQLYHGWSHDFFNNYPSSVSRPDRILIDLGISMFHYEKSGGGFSFRKDEELDMRLDPTGPIRAADLVNTLSEHDLADLIYRNAEERFSRRIAHAIVRERRKSPIQSTKVLADIIVRAVPSSYRYGGIHPATKTFQALRIEVNGELSRLEILLERAFRTLQIGGRMGVITFHSLEDRIVKNFFREKNKDCTCSPEAPICTCRGKRLLSLVTRKPIVPEEQEIQYNPPSRSAKFRVIEKLADEDVVV
ncbi:MAG: 16S rRNA (cytosine(1402)-N(4))-methyltransferase RsmH [Treponemataceae bacterium]|nr:16S rRNA (cytosine(1402)-N(4))-methyltransferase RsmH [Treponemataceae bacterium]